jgi:hypothetical protein
LGVTLSGYGGRGAVGAGLQCRIEHDWWNTQQRLDRQLWVAERML